VSYSRTRTERNTFRLESNNWNGQATVTRSEVTLDCLRSGQSVPNWRARIKSGQAATSPFVGNYFNMRESKPFRGQITRKQPSPSAPVYAESVYGTVSDGVPSFGDLNTSLTDTQALTKIYGALRGAQSHASGMTVLGELRETLRSLRRPYTTAVQLVDTYLDKAFKASKRYRWKDGSAAHRRRVRPRVEKALADAWLETAFGLVPLISDVKDIAEAVARFENDSHRERIFGRAENVVSGSNARTIVGTATSYIQIQKDVKETMTHKVQYLAFLEWKQSADFGSNRRLVELMGFRPDLFIPTVYELLPWSFLVDYFSNLGDVIETGCQSQSLVSFAMKTTILESKRSCLQTPVPTSAPIPIVYSLCEPGSVTQVRKRVTRSSYSQLPAVPLLFSLPGSKMKYANMLALWKSNTLDGVRVPRNSWYG
jgi:hypothetical protein